MGQLRFETPETPEDFCNVLENFNVVLPVEPSSEDLGVLVDANGQAVLTIDVNRERDDVEVIGIVSHLCMAINAAGGYPVTEVIAEDPEKESV